MQHLCPAGLQSYCVPNPSIYRYSVPLPGCPCGTNTGGVWETDHLSSSLVTAPDQEELLLDFMQITRSWILTIVPGADKILGVLSGEE